MIRREKNWQAASRVAKDRAMLLKEEIIAKLHGKG